MEQQINAIIEPAITDEGFRLVRSKMMEQSGRRILQIMIERSSGEQINVDDCAEISRTVSALLDVHDPISGEYHLEVTSPGIDRPLITLEDFDRFAGYETKLETQFPINGRKRYRGLLKGVADDQIIIEVDGTAHHIAYDTLAQAKLVMSDALLEAYKQGLLTH